MIRAASILCRVNLTRYPRHEGDQAEMPEHRCSNCIAQEIECTYEVSFRTFVILQRHSYECRLDLVVKGTNNFLTHPLHARIYEARQLCSSPGEPTARHEEAVHSGTCLLLVCYLFPSLGVESLKTSSGGGTVELGTSRSASVSSWSLGLSV